MVAKLWSLGVTKPNPQPTDALCELLDLEPAASGESDETLSLERHQNSLSPALVNEQWDDWFPLFHIDFLELLGLLLDSSSMSRYVKCLIL